MSKIKHITGNSKYVLLVCICAIVIAAVVFSVGAFKSPELGKSENNQAAQPSDQLNTLIDGRNAPALSEEDQSFLKKLLAEGMIRPATIQDKQEWISLAEQGNHEVSVIAADYGHTFVILKPVKEINISSGFVTFIVAKGIPFPKKYGNAAFYNMNNGGWVFDSKYDDGSGEKIGIYPHEY